MKNGNGTQKGDSQRYVGAWLPKSVHARLKAIAAREKRSIQQLLEFKVREIVKAGASGIDAAA